jgi:aspartate kinase
MRIFKFGGASVKDAEGIRNVYNVLQTVGFEDVLLVISAMGKTTNALEVVIKNYFDKSPELQSSIQEVKKYHNQILLDLFEDDKNLVFKEVNTLFVELDHFISQNKSPNYNFVYDQIVSFGELISTTIISNYMGHMGIKTQWNDVRNLIKTDTNYRDANVDWETTQKLISKNVKKKILTVTQGFLGSDENNFTTTLGREGSDYTAAIFAYCLNAESVTIWKDVPGVMNADPRYFENARLLNQISYREAIELAFYGATVIHPKTLQPLQKKEIPLFVKSFINPTLPGTSVSKGADLEPHLPCFILKKNQLLLSLSSIDFSFIMEENISEIFALLHQYKMKVSLIQNSAISFSVCIDDKFGNFTALKSILSKKFKISYNENVSLYTIRHFDEKASQIVEKNKVVLLKQVSRETMQIITKEEKHAIAIHEAGHATVSWMLQHAAPLVKVTIVPRGQSLGAAWYLPEERQIVRTEQMLDEMCATMGGRAAEKVVFNKISTGALSDLEKVTKQARAMVTVYGLNDKIGNITYYDSSGQSDYNFSKPYSDDTAKIIDTEISGLIEEQYQRAITILTENRIKLEALAGILIEKEVIFKDDLETIFGKRPFDIVEEEPKTISEIIAETDSEIATE